MAGARVVGRSPGGDARVVPPTGADRIDVSAVVPVITREHNGDPEDEFGPAAEGRKRLGLVALCRLIDYPGRQ